MHKLLSVFTVFMLSCPLYMMARDNKMQENWYDIDGDGVKEYLDKGKVLKATNQGFIELFKFPTSTQVPKWVHVGKAELPAIMCPGYSVGSNDHYPSQVYAVTKQSSGSISASSNPIIVSNPLCALNVIDFDNDGAMELKETYRTAAMAEQLRETVWKLDMTSRPFLSRMNILTMSQYLGLRQGLYIDSSIPGMGDMTIGYGVAIDPTAFANFNTVDLNGDGISDLLDPTFGKVYYNLGDGTWVVDNLGGRVVTCDLNDDRLADFIVYNADKSEVSLFSQSADGQINQKSLLSGYKCGTNLWCYDFDKDGDVDVLIPIDGSYGKITYFVILENTGNCNFKRHEQYIEAKVTADLCMDIDNDGNYDIVVYNDTNGKVEYYKINGLTIENTSPMAIADDSDYSIVDLYGDGNNWIRYTEGNNSKTKKINTVQNTRPQKPNAPTLYYDSKKDVLKISWDKGFDKETPSSDLTYELRIGTAPGKCDIVCVDALADGTRRSNTDGNHGRCLNRTIDVSKWVEGTYYISLQTVDGNKMASPFSEYAVFKKTSPSAAFYMSYETPLMLGSPIAIYEKSTSIDNTHQWDFDGANVVNLNGCIGISYDTPGEKCISHIVTSNGGTISKDFQKVTVCSSALEIDRPVFDTQYSPTVYYTIDIDEDGFDEVLGDKYGLFEWSQDGTYKSIKKLYNNRICERKYTDGIIFDFNNDGHNDIMLINSPYYSELTPVINDGDKNMYFINPVALNNSDGHVEFAFDINNDGQTDVLAYKSYMYARSKYLIYHNQDGTFNADLTLPTYSLRDLNNDGLIDYVDAEWDDQNYYFFYYYNNGDFTFTKSDVKLSMDINHGLSLLEDFDNNGKLDILAYVYHSENSQAYYDWYVIWDDNKIMPMPDFPVTSGGFWVFDIDNDGFYDLNFVSSGGSNNELNVVKFLPNRNYSIEKYDLNEYLDGVGVFYSSNQFYRGDGKFQFTHRLILDKHNEAPSSPTNLRYTQTGDAVVIEWDHSVDKETPAINMRYNISVKKKGASGDFAYLFSPGNDGRNNVHVTNTRIYPQSNRFTIPISNIPPGEYEVKVQGIDMWNLQSDFSESLSVVVTESIDLVIPASTFVGYETPVKVEGNAANQIEWDGGIASQDGSTYIVKWESAGYKNVKLGNKTYIILVKQLPDDSCNLPERVMAGATVKVKGENVLNARWTSEPPTMSTRSGDDGSLIFIFDEPKPYTVTMRFVEDNVTFTRKYSVTAFDGNTPHAITVQMDDNSKKNQITFDTSSAPDDAIGINIYDFDTQTGISQLLGSLDLDKDIFVDDQSAPEVRPSTYLFAYALPYGEGPRSKPYRPVHCAVNYAKPGTYNIIWNKYLGDDISCYRILRGSSPDNMKVIWEVQPAYSSYIDDSAPEGQKVYYAVEAVLSEAVASRSGALSARSNVVSSDQAQIVKLAESIGITSEGGSHTIDGQSTIGMQLYATVYPADATIKEVDWAVDKGTDIVEISDDGYITAKSNGNATIRAYSKDGSDIYTEYTVSVINIVDKVLVKEILINPSTVSIEVGESVKLVCTVLPANATNLDYVLDYVDDAASYVQIGSDNTITAIAKGHAMVCARAIDGSNVVGYCSINVQAGIDDALDDAVFVYQFGGDIIIIGKPSDEFVRIYGMDGRLLYYGQDSQIPWSADGIYVIIVGDKVFKIHTK